MVSLDPISVAKEDLRKKEKLPLLHDIFPHESWPPNPPEWPSQREAAQKAEAKIFSIDCTPRQSSPEGLKAKLIDKIRRAIDPEQSTPIDEPRTLSLHELHQLYSGTSVPQHRYFAPRLTEAATSPELAPHPSKWLAEVPDVDLPGVVSAWLETNRSTEYEQLYCIGLDPESGQLTALLTVRKGLGYAGGPRTSGSREHVAFWVDRGAGLEYEGTASTTVHDFGWLPPAGLEYSVSLPMDLLSHLRSEGRKTVKVRAVLSWNTPPSTTDPNAPVVWGNILESRILIPSIRDCEDEEISHRSPRDSESEVGVESDGRVIDAAIRALTGMALGPDAGLTVLPNGAMAGSGIDRGFTIHAGEIEDGGDTFALCVWNRAGVNRGTESSQDHTPAGFWRQDRN